MKNVILFMGSLHFYLMGSPLRSRLSGRHATLPLSGDRCVTSRKTTAKDKGDNFTMEHAVTLFYKNQACI